MFCLGCDFKPSINAVQACSAIQFNSLPKNYLPLHHRWTHQRFHTTAWNWSGVTQVRRRDHLPYLIIHCKYRINLEGLFAFLVNQWKSMKMFLMVWGDVIKMFSKCFLILWSQLKMSSMYTFTTRRGRKSVQFK